MSPQTLQSRLDSLYRHLDEEGWHVHANTVALALEALGRSLTPIESDVELTEALKDMARRAFPTSMNNEWAMADWCKRIIGMMEQVPPEEYARVYHSIYKEK